MFSNRCYQKPFTKMNFLSYCNWYFELAMISNTSRCRHRFLSPQPALFPFYFIFCCKFFIFIFHAMCTTTCIIFFFGWKKWIMKNKHLTDLVWILRICVVIIRGWDWGVVRDWGKTSLSHIKYTLVPLISHTLSEVNQPVLVGQTNFLWLKGK